MTCKMLIKELQNVLCNSGQLSLSDDLKIKKKYWSIKKNLKNNIRIKKMEKVKRKKKKKKNLSKSHY